jgi:hypothetical protein
MIPQKYTRENLDNSEVYYKNNNLAFSIFIEDKNLDVSKLCNSPAGLECGEGLQEILLDGQKAYRFDIADGLGVVNNIYYSLSDNKTLRILFSGDYGDKYEVTDDWADDTINKILASFKFSNKDISDWQNFKDANFAYSFSYPKNWNIKTHYNGYLLSYTDIVNYEIGSNNAPISFGAYATDSKMDKVLSFGNKQYHIDTDKRLAPDSVMIIDGKKFDKYDLIDSGQYEGDSAGNVVILVSQDSLSASENVRLVFTWEEKPAGNVLANNNKSDFLDIIATIKIE